MLPSDTAQLCFSSAHPLYASPESSVWKHAGICAGRAAGGGAGEPEEGGAGGRVTGRTPRSASWRTRGQRPRPPSTPRSVRSAKPPSARRRCKRRPLRPASRPRTCVIGLRRLRASCRRRRIAASRTCGLLSYQVLHDHFATAMVHGAEGRLSVVCEPHTPRITAKPYTGGAPFCGPATKHTWQAC